METKNENGDAKTTEMGEEPDQSDSAGTHCTSGNENKTPRSVPVGLLNHPDCIQIWSSMIAKEETTLKLRNPCIFNGFTSVTPRMRAILLDWLMEVAASFHLTRVTYYLSVDYFDRFLSVRPDVPKSVTQLVGITCLYIAAKVEEIHVPSIFDFAYVCDDACNSQQIVSWESLILKSLEWEVILTTPSDWLSLYMQLHLKSEQVVKTALNRDKDFVFPQYSAYQFIRGSQLMDLMSLDPGFLRFSYSLVAAAAIYFMYGRQIALTVSGLSWEELEPCIDYMEVFYAIIKQTPDPGLHCLEGSLPEEESSDSKENYSFQTHCADSMAYFEKATISRLARYNQQKT